MSSPDVNEEEEAGLSDSWSESDSNCLLSFAEGALRPLPFSWGGGLRLGAGGMVLAPSLSSFASLAPPPPIARQSPTSSHPNHPTSPKCAH